MNSIGGRGHGQASRASATTPTAATSSPIWDIALPAASTAAGSWRRRCRSKSLRYCSRALAASDMGIQCRPHEPVEDELSFLSPVLRAQAAGRPASSGTRDCCTAVDRAGRPSRNLELGRAISSATGQADAGRVMRSDRRRTSG